MFNICVLKKTNKFKIFLSLFYQNKNKADFIHFYLSVCAQSCLPIMTMLFDV